MDKKSEITMDDTDALAREPATQAQAGGLSASDAMEKTSEKTSAFADRKLHWTEGVQGKMAIRTFSRGVLGAAFFAWGARFGGKQMGDYNPNGFNLDKDGNRVAGYDSNKPLQFVAHTIDKLIGEPLKMAVNAVGGDGEEFVTFRPTRSYGEKSAPLPNEPHRKERVRGRTLGSELVSITFDFAMASTGNAIGDELMLGIFNPKARAKWMKDGKFEFPHAVKTLCSKVWHIASFRAGEDVAVALPYAFYLRAQRNVLNKLDPGFGYDSDRAANGGSVKVDDKLNIVGDYQATGMADLWGRFTAYNVMTLMYRETYRYTAGAFKEWKGEGYPLPKLEDLSPSRLLGQATQAVKDVALWASRSVAKGLIIMIPSVPFFFAGRSPQSKFMGLAIHPEKGVVAFNTGKKDVDDLHRVSGVDSTQIQPKQWNTINAGGQYENFNIANGYDARYDDKNHPVYFVKDLMAGPGKNGNVRANPAGGGVTLPFGKNQSPYANGIGGWGKLTDTVGGAIFDAGTRMQYVEGDPAKGKTWLNRGIEQAGEKIFGKKVSASLGFDNGNDLIRKYVNAATSYTPYFAVKTDLMGNLMDNQQMNVSLERTIKGLASANLHEFKAGIGDTWRTLTRRPLQDEKQLAELGRRYEGKAEDSSPTSQAYAKSFVDRVGKEPSPARGWEPISRGSESHAARAQREATQKNTVIPTATLH